MWYDLLIDSLLGIKEGVHDPYTFTTGQGCGYVTAGERDPYTNMTENSILYNASRDLYFIDEGEVAGVVSPALLMGDVNPSIGEYSFSNPLTKVGVMQTIYAAALPKVIVERVKHCKRPGGSVNITVDEAAAILFQWKEAMEATWSEGWDNDNEGEVQFVAVFDDLGGVSGTAGRLLEEITMDSTTLTVVAIFLIFFFSILFLAGPNWLESRVLITFIGTALVVLAFFGAMGFSLLLGLKISVITAWTLPFVMIGLGELEYSVTRVLNEFSSHRLVFFY
jgi:predicted RND superfamily exporter protein